MEKLKVFLFDILDLESHHYFDSEAEAREDAAEYWTKNIEEFNRKRNRVLLSVNTGGN